MAKKRANGEGNIRKRKDGRWEGRYTAGYDEKTGKRLIKNVLGKTQAEVKEKLAKAVAEAESVDVRRADEYTLGTWLQTWYELYAKPHLRFSTAEYYRRGIELHITPRLGDIPLKKLTGRDLQWLYKDLQEHGRLREAQKGKQPGLSDSTIRGIHTMLHNALDRAVKERLIVRNPADDCIPPKIPKHEMKILPPEQIKSYLTAADQRGVLPMFYPLRLPVLFPRANLCGFRQYTLSFQTAIAHNLPEEIPPVDMKNSIAKTPLRHSNHDTAD